MSAHFEQEKKEFVRLAIVKEEPVKKNETPAISADLINFYEPEEVHRFEIVKKNAKIGTNLKPNIKAIAKTNAIK
jgi:hypothetical protein